MRKEQDLSTASLLLLLLLALAAIVIVAAASNSSNMVNELNATSSSTLATALPATHPWLLPHDDDGLLASLWGSPERRDEFFVEDFGQRVVYLSSADLPSILQNVDLHALYRTSPVTLRNRSSMDIVDTHKLSFEAFQSVINQQGGSATLEVSTLESKYANNPLIPLKRQLEHAFGLPLSFNIYHSGPSGSALRRHADRYDVLVLQLAGAKEWTLCLPRPPPNATTSFNEADAASMVDRQFRNDEQRPCGVSLDDYSTFGYQCCKETNVTLRHGMNCDNIKLQKGDILYMPQGIVHAAQVPSPYRTSTHAAIGFKKLPFQYGDVLLTFLQLAASVSFSSYPNTWKRLQHLVGNDILQSPRLGLAFRRLLPPWIWRYYQACLDPDEDDTRDDQTTEEIHQPSTTPPPPSHWKCDRRKFEEAQQFLMNSLQSMLTVLQETIENDRQFSSSASASGQHQKEETQWLDDLLLAEYLGEELTREKQQHPANTIRQDAIYVHLKEKIDFGILEREERQQIERVEKMQQQTNELMDSLLGSSSFGSTSGSVGISDLVESLTLDLKSTGSRRHRSRAR